MMYLLILGGFVLLVGGAEIMVRGAVVLAEHLGVSPMVIGMTVVAIGTSAPELVVTVNATLAGSPGLAVGNIVGSNIANSLLILGVACILMPIVEKPAALKRDGFMLLGGTLLFIVLSLRGELDALAGGILIVGFFVFLSVSYWRESHNPELSADHLNEVDDLHGWPKTVFGSVLAVVLGLAGLAFGADLLVRGGTDVARNFGVSEEVIGLTLFALGTSLPELAASVIAALKGHADVGVGNVVGSNLFNLLGVGGVAASIDRIPVLDQLVGFDIWIMLAATLVLMPVLILGWRISRAAGGVLLAAYVAYIWIQAYGVGRVFDITG